MRDVLGMPAWAPITACVVTAGTTSTLGIASSGPPTGMRARFVADVVCIYRDCECEGRLVVTEDDIVRDHLERR